MIGDADHPGLDAARPGVESLGDGRRFYSHFIRGMVALREIRAGAGRGGLALLPRDSCGWRCAAGPRVGQ
jgi:hypothetical protein